MIFFPKFQTWLKLVYRVARKQNPDLYFFKADFEWGFHFGGCILNKSLAEHRYSDQNL